MTDKRSDILVSVAMAAFNHEHYIAEAIEGVLKQETSFRFQLVISEDCSWDTTRSICVDYQKRYPDIIKLLLPEKNLGMMPNLMHIFEACEGKYIAMCEGDDYWTDPYKLQKQVDAMEAQPTLTMCAHNADILEYGILKPSPAIAKNRLAIEDIIAQDWGIMTASILFRKDALPIPHWFYTVKNGDYALQLLLALGGDTLILPETMSVYRKHEAGVSATLRPLSQAAWLISLLYDFNKYTDGRYRKDIVKKIRRVYKNQIGFAKEYHLRKATVILTFFSYFVPVNPFWIRHLRK